MIYTITVVSPEVEDFDLELQIESSATFADLHRLIRESCGWDAPAAVPSPSAAAVPSASAEGPAPAKFYLCDHRWHREHTIVEHGYEDDTMDVVELGDHLEDEGQRLQYLFDPAAKRLLLIEVSRIAYGKHIDAPHCRRRHGTPPALFEEAAAVPSASAEGQAAPSSNAPSSLLAQLNAAALSLDDDDDDDLEPTDDDLFEIEELDLDGFDFTEE